MPRVNWDNSGAESVTDLKPNLIYDVGLHRGEDTDFYLKKGFHVVALEANPELVVLQDSLQGRYCARSIARH